MALSETRLASAAKGQYHKTDPDAVRLIAQDVSVHAGANIMDTSCGEGEALAILGEAWGATTWGNEIERNRYEAAKLVLDHVTHGPQETLQVTGEADIIFLNPPYDRGAKQRYEIEHTRQAMGWLRPNGLFIAVLPRSILETIEFWRMWVTRMQNTNIRRFPEPEFSKWKQFVIYGTRRWSDSSYQYSITMEAERKAKEIADDSSIHLTTNILGVISTQIVINAPYHREDTLSEIENRLPAAADILADLEDMPDILDTPEYELLTIPPPSMQHGNPAMPCRAGHVVQLGAAGMFNGQEMNIDGPTYLVSGDSYKYEAQTIEVEEDATKVIATEKPAYVIYALSLEDGHFLMLDSYKGQQQYRDFLKDHTQALIDGVNKSNPPAYNWDYSPWVELFDQIHGPRVLPGHKANGALNAQKHIVAAILTVNDKLKTYQNAILVGEMGVGKTITSIITMAIKSGMLTGNRKARIVVMCPAVVAPKWVFEAEKILREIPDFKAFLIGREVKNPHLVAEHPETYKDALPRLRWAQLKAIRDSDVRPLTEKELAEWCKIQNDFAPSQAKRVKRRKPIADAIEAMEYDGPSMLVIPYEVAKNGSPWEHRALTRIKHVKWTEEVVTKDRWGYPVTRTIVHDEDAEVYVCPNCQEMLFDENGRPWTKGKEKEDQFCTSTTHAVRQKCPSCGSPLWQCVPFQYGGRWPVCEFLSQKYARRYHLIIDEVHNARGGSTNIGAASQDLISGALHTIAMTGTIFNGMARSLFYLLYRLNPEFRQMYEYNEASKFVSHHGFTETITTTRESRSTSSYGYNRTSESVHVREAPGASPQMVAMLMPFTVFLKLNDIGLELPPRTEIAVPVEMDEELKAEYDKLDSAYTYCAMQFIKGNRGPLSRWLQAALGWLDCPKAEAIEDVADLDEIMMPEGGYPKDQVLINVVTENINENRGVAIFCEQVNIRDARYRIQELLAKNDIHSFVLERKVNAEDRMPWIEKETEIARKKGQAPVLIANGNLIKEGVDLLEFPTIIEVGQHYNITSLEQRLARSHRLGQTKDVRLYFLYYQGTRQEEALKRIAAKLRAAKQVNGEVAAGLSEFDMDEHEFVQELMRNAQELTGGQIAEMMKEVRFDTKVKRKKPVQLAEEKPKRRRKKKPKLEAIAITQTAVATKNGGEVTQLGFSF